MGWRKDCWLQEALCKESEFLNFDAMRQASQCLGRVIRSKRDLTAIYDVYVIVVHDMPMITFNIYCDILSLH